MENKYRYIISLLILSFALAVPAMAQTSGAGEETIHQDKTATYDYETHVGEITLTSFVPGEMKKTKSALPVDIVLVLDYSGSMSSSYSVKSSQSYTEYAFGTKYVYSDPPTGYEKLTTSTKIKFTDGNDYKPTIIHKGTLPSGNGANWAYITVSGSNYFLRPDGGFVKSTTNTSTISGSSTSTYPIDEDGNLIEPADGNKGVIFTVATKSTKTISGSTNRIKALHAAVESFINQINENGKKNNLTHRVSLVQFQKPTYPKFYSSGKESNYTDPSSPYFLKERTDDIYSEDKNKTSVIKQFTAVNDGSIDNILRPTFNLDANGPTATDFGIRLAQLLLQHKARPEAYKVVVVFTDGKPEKEGGKTSWQTDDANSAVGYTNTIKSIDNADGGKVKVFTVGIFSGTDASTYATQIDNFMNTMSSNYTTASSYTDRSHPKDASDTTPYYQNASDGNLIEVFKGIADEIEVETNEKYDVNTTMKDFVNNNYFQYPDNADEGDIKVYSQNCTSYTKGTDGAADIYEFNSALTDITDKVHVVLTRANPSVPESKDLVEVYGFNYSENWCGMDITSGTPGVIHGKQLVIKFPFIFKGGTEVSGALQTNTEDSGVYPAQKNDDGTPKVDEDGKPIPEEETDSKFTPPVIYFNTLTINRKNLEPGETAIYEVTRDGSFICRIALDGEAGKETSGVSKTIYGLPGDAGVKFKVSETNWNWAYHEAGSTLPSDEKTVTISSGQPVPLKYEFSGAHLDKTGDHPAERHNHGESFKVNLMRVP